MSELDIDDLFPGLKPFQEPLWVPSKEAQEWFDTLDEESVALLYGQHVTPYGIEHGYLTFKAWQDHSYWRRSSFLHGL